MKVGSGGNLGLSREYFKKLFGPMFNSWCNCPLTKPISEREEEWNALLGLE